MWCKSIVTKFSKLTTKRIIPCLDIKDGRVVKGINFINLVDAGNPAEQAKIYNDISLLGYSEYMYSKLILETERYLKLYNLVT